MHEEVLTSTFDRGRFRVTRHLMGLGLRQLFVGIDSLRGGLVLISYDKLPKHTTVDAFVDSTGSKAPGVLDLLFAGRPDQDIPGCWGVIERVPPNTQWLPDVI